jgi:hypothetical protein
MGIESRSGNIINFPVPTHNNTERQNQEDSLAHITDLNERRSAHLFETPKLRKQLSLMRDYWGVDMHELREEDKSVERYLLQFPTGTPFELDGEMIFPFLQIWVPNRAVSFRDQNLYVVLEEVNDIQVERNAAYIKGVQVADNKSGLIIRNNPFSSSLLNLPKPHSSVSPFERADCLRNGRARFDRINKNRNEEGLIF